MNTLQEPLKNPQTVYHTGGVAIGKDLVFGWVVLGYSQGDERASWQPIAQLAPHEQMQVHRKVDANPVFPQEFRDWLSALVRQQDQAVQELLRHGPLGHNDTPVQ